MIFGVFGIENDGLNLFANLLIFFLVAVWLALVYWTYADARRRIEDPMLVWCATVASLFPYIGTVVYTIVRPPEYIEDARERSLEIQSAQGRLKQLQRQACPNCNYPIGYEYLRCPSCSFKLKEPCESCAKPVDPSWRLCPYCETALAPASGVAEETATRRQSRKAPRKAASRAPRGATKTS